ncbi:uncharacterized protein LOC134266882 [Saccostrea cucullata]|uniref:uncharacterized protein LOC134245915 n=1 Tax=Saccostrea cuccullata TaxID=36930 RepID=UPI002ED39646
MNPAMTPCAAPPGYYGGPYMPSLNPGGCRYPYPCTPVPGNYLVPFPQGNGGPFPQPFFGPPQPCPSIPFAYGPYPRMFPPEYMVPQQAYPQPCMYGGPPMPPLTQLQDGGAVQYSTTSVSPVQCPTMSRIEIPNNHGQELSDGSASLKLSDASSCESVLPAAVNFQQQMPTLTAAVHQQQQIPTVTGFSQIPSSDVSPAGMQ